MTEREGYLEFHILEMVIVKKGTSSFGIIGPKPTMSKEKPNFSIIIYHGALNTIRFDFRI